MNWSECPHQNDVKDLPYTKSKSASQHTWAIFIKLRMYCKNKRLFPTTFSWSALIRVPCSAYKTQMHGDVCMHRVVVQKQLKITNTPEYSYSTLGMYIDTYLFTSMYINIARERERTKTLYQTIKVQYMSRVRKMDGFPLISSLLNQVQKILAGWHRFANSKPSTGFSAPSTAFKQQTCLAVKPPRKIAAWKWRAWEPESCHLTG